MPALQAVILQDDKRFSLIDLNLNSFNEKFKLHVSNNNQNTSI